MLRLFKALFGGLFNFFGILFGGIWDTVFGSKSEKQDPAPIPTPAPVIVQSPPAPQSTPQPAPTPVPQPTPAPTSSAGNQPEPVQPAMASAMSNMPLRSTPSVPVEFSKPFDSTDIPLPRPKRPLSKSIDMFKDMAREIPSARR